MWWGLGVKEARAAAVAKEPAAGEHAGGRAGRRYRSRRHPDTQTRRRGQPYTLGHDGHRHTHTHVAGTHAGPHAKQKRWQLDCITERQAPDKGSKRERKGQREKESERYADFGAKNQNDDIATAAALLARFSNRSARRQGSTAGARPQPLLRHSEARQRGASGATTYGSAFSMSSSDSRCALATASATEGPPAGAVGATAAAAIMLEVRRRGRREKERVCGTVREREERRSKERGGKCCCMQALQQYTRRSRVSAAAAVVL